MAARPGIPLAVEFARTARIDPSTGYAPLMRVAVLLLSLLVASAAQAGVNVGDPAPPFSLVGSDGKTHSLTDALAEGAVVVAWFPKAFTPG